MVNETIKIPDLGGVDEVVVLEILVKVGDSVTADQPLMSLESEKASMDVPSDRSGIIKEIILKVGDKVREGDACVTVESGTDKQESQASTDTTSVASAHTTAPTSNQSSVPTATKAALPVMRTVKAQASTEPIGASTGYASPTVRRLARQLGIDLAVVPASGSGGRVTQDDLVAVIQSRQGLVPAQTAANSASTPPSPSWQDPTKFGPCEQKKPSKIKNATAKAMSQSWAHVVHVTQFDQVDITALEAFRCHHKDALRAESIRLTMLAFNIKALVPALIQHPNVNASYQASEKIRWEKRYYHVGFAVDTADGLVVPVIQNIDQLSIIDIAKQLGTLSQKARAGQLTPKDMVGASFTISSLGGLGGTYFTPIVNQPQSAILGVSRAATQPIWDGSSFQPRLMLPLSLSYDHRLIDGAEAMRFLNDYSAALQALADCELDKA